MKINVNENGLIVIGEVYSGAIIETREGNQLGFCLRDDTVELHVMPKKGVSEWFRVNMQTGMIEPMQSFSAGSDGQQPLESPLAMG